MRLPSSAWFAYPAVLAVQARALWGVWDAELTAGDTSSYFQQADLWTGDLRVDLAWSPLYTSFYGTVLRLVGEDAQAATSLHRVLIVVAGAVLVLALLRRLLPPSVALLVACWWAVLPIVFDTLYEVHLFAALPLLAAALVLTSEPGPWRRGWALALLAASVVLVRNEALVAAGVLAAAILVSELRAKRRGDGTPGRRLAVAIGVPLLVAAVVVGAGYSRSVLQGDELREALHAKQTLVVCQNYAVSYAQRHPEYTDNPYLSCEELMARVFRAKRPTLREAWAANARAMASFTAWNAWLLPNGLQLALFNAVSGDDNPDVVPSRLEWTGAAVLSLALLALFLLGGRRLWRDRVQWAATVRPQRWSWLALGGFSAAAVLVVVFNVRPRPSYMFGLAFAVMAASGLCLAAVLRARSLQRWGDVAAVVVPIALVLGLPPHYRDDPAPLADQYAHLRPVAESITEPRMVVPGFPEETCSYLAPNEKCSALVFASDIRPLVSGARPLSAVLAGMDIDLFYADSAMAVDPPVAELLNDPRCRGWRVVRSDRDTDGRWAVLARARSPRPPFQGCK